MHTCMHTYAHLHLAVLSPSPSSPAFVPSFLDTTPPPSPSTPDDGNREATEDDVKAAIKSLRKIANASVPALLGYPGSFGHFITPGEDSAAVPVTPNKAIESQLLALLFAHKNHVEQEFHEKGIDLSLTVDESYLGTQGRKRKLDRVGGNGELAKVWSNNFKRRSETFLRGINDFVRKHASMLKDFTTVGVDGFRRVKGKASFAELVLLPCSMDTWCRVFHLDDPDKLNIGHLWDIYQRCLVVFNPKLPDRVFSDHWKALNAVRCYSREDREKHFPLIPQKNQTELTSCLHLLRKFPDNKSVRARCKENNDLVAAAKQSQRRRRSVGKVISVPVGCGRLTSYFVKREDEDESNQGNQGERSRHGRHGSSKNQPNDDGAIDGDEPSQANRPEVPKHSPSHGYPHGSHEELSQANPPEGPTHSPSHGYPAHDEGSHGGHGSHGSHGHPVRVSSHEEEDILRTVALWMNKKLIDSTCFLQIVDAIRAYDRRRQ